MYSPQLDQVSHWTDILKTPLTADFNDNGKGTPVHFLEADASSPTLKVVKPILDNGGDRDVTVHSSENGMHGTNAENHATLKDRPVGRCAAFTDKLLHKRDFMHDLFSPRALGPSFTDLLDKTFPQNELDCQLDCQAFTDSAFTTQAFTTQQQSLCSQPQPSCSQQQTPCSCHPHGFHTSSFRLGPHRSYSAMNVARDPCNTSQHIHLRAEQAHESEVGSVSSQPDAHRKNAAAPGLVRKFRPASAVAPTRAISQPAINAHHQQQAVETLYERQRPIVHRNPPSQDMAAQRGNVAVDDLTFDSLEDALASQAPRQNVDPNLDRTYPRGPKSMKHYVNQLYCAMADMSELTDSEKIEKSWEATLSGDRNAVEVTCWVILDATMRAHRQKEPLVPLRSTKNPKGKKKFDSFRDHINALCSGMRKHKTICQHLMAPTYSLGYIDDPLAGADRVGNNRKVNQKKSLTIEAGRRAMGGRTQNLEMHGTQRQSIELYGQHPYGAVLPSTEQDVPVYEEMAAPRMESPVIKQEASYDGVPKAGKSKKRKATEPGTGSKRKKSRHPRTSTFPIQQGPDGKHYVLDASDEQYHPHLTTDHLTRGQSIDDENIDPNLTASTSNLAHEQNDHDHDHHHPQHGYDDQHYEQPQAQPGQWHPQPHNVAPFDGAIFDGTDFVMPTIDGPALDAMVRDNTLPRILTTRSDQLIEPPQPSPYFDLRSGEPGVDLFGAGGIGDDFLALTDSVISRPFLVGNQESQFENDAMFDNNYQDAEGEPAHDDDDGDRASDGGEIIGDDLFGNGGDYGAALGTGGFPALIEA